MNCVPRVRTLDTMIEIDAGIDGPDWGGLVMDELAELPTGTVTLLLADVEGSTRLWERSPAVMADAVTHLDEVLVRAVAQHNGVRPVEQGEGDSFVIAFARATDAVACALTLQTADLTPITLRIGIHTGEVRLRDEGNYIGPTINRTARLRDLGHGGQTLISGVTEALVVDTLPDGATLADLGSHVLRDLPRPERVMQLGHAALRADFPPLRTADSVAAHNVPKQLTTFIGRQNEVRELRAMLNEHRLVTITGIGGAGKTRLAVRLANELSVEYPDGAWFVDLAPISTPELLEPTVAAAFSLPDDPSRSVHDAIIGFVGDRRMLLVVDNCEHLVEPCADLIDRLLSDSDGLTVLTTSREPVGVNGEVCWRMPSLSLSDEAVELFVERARRVRADFALTDDNTDAVAEICRRLDGLPLAIELAAARMRALTLTELADSLNDRFRLLTGGSRTAVRRQQTLRASVDWSHALLSDDERMLFRQLSVFTGGFDLAAAQSVTGDAERYHVLDQLTLLVDKSLVVVDEAGTDTRYRLLETMRQYALEKLAESGEAGTVRDRHRDHFLEVAARLDSPTDSEYERRLSRAESDLDNLRTALGWCVENNEFDTALTLASSLQPLWCRHSHRREGDAWFRWLLDNGDGLITPAVVAHALADKAELEMFSNAAAAVDHARQAVAIARDTDDRALLLHTLRSSLFVIGYEYTSEAAPLVAESIELARELDDRPLLCQILTRRAGTAVVKGDLFTARSAAEEGRDLADAIGVDTESRLCRVYLGWAQVMQGELDEAKALFTQLTSEDLVADQMWLWPGALHGLATAHAFLGEVEAALAVAHRLITAADDEAEYFKGMGYAALAVANLVGGDVDAADEASELAWTHLGVQHGLAVVQRAFTSGVTALVKGDLETATRHADESIAVATGWHLALALIVRGRIAIAAGDLASADAFVHKALSHIVETTAYSWLPDAIECVAHLAAAECRFVSAARLCAAADAIRRRTGMVRYAVYQPGYDRLIADVRMGMSDEDFDAAWGEGAAMTRDEAIAYAMRGRGDRKRPDIGWDSLTPAEIDVVKLVAEGLTNKDVATRLFVSPRTVQSHLAHVFTKLGVTTRTQLAQEVARHR